MSSAFRRLGIYLSSGKSRPAAMRQSRLWGPGYCRSLRGFPLVEKF